MVLATATMLSTTSGSGSTSLDSAKRVDGPMPINTRRNGNSCGRNASGTVAEAGALLLVYSAGLSVPFLPMGLAYNGVQPLYERVKGCSGVINAVSGAMLIVVGILVFTDSLVGLNGWFDFGFLGDISART